MMLDPHLVRVFVTMTIAVARERLGCLDVPLVVLKLGNGSHECLSPQHARPDRDQLAHTLVRQARYLVGDRRFGELVELARTEALESQ